MASPKQKGAEMPSETVSVAKSHKPVHAEMKRRRSKTQQSPFKVPDANSIIVRSLNEKRDRKEEMRKFLALPINEKPTYAVRTLAKLKNEPVGGAEEEEKEGEKEEEEDVEENERMENLKRIKSKTALPRGTWVRGATKGTLLKRESVAKDNKHDLISMERQKAVLDLSLMSKRSEIAKMDKAIAKEERQLKQLERLIERDNTKFEEFLRENEKKSEEARTQFEEEAKIKQKKNAEIKRLRAEIGTIESELAKFEEVLTEYSSYQELLFKLSPPEWQEEQRAKASRAAGGPPDEQEPRRGEPEELPGEKGGSSRGEQDHCNVKPGTLPTDEEVQESGGDREPPSIAETRLSTANSSTLDSNCKPTSDNLEYEDDPQLYFTDPKQLLDLMTELTEQNLSLIQNSARVEETLEDLKHSIEKTRKKTENDEEKLTLRIKDLKERIEIEKARSIKLEQMVQLHLSLNTEDQDVMQEALSEKVAEVHRCCVDDRMANLSTLEKLSNIESRMSSLLQGLESLPEDKLELMKRIKDSERRSRQREEKLQEQRDKQRERMRRYMERSLADSKKRSGRRLMPRCMPITHRARVRTLDNIPAEEDMQECLFGLEDTE